MIGELLWIFVILVIIVFSIISVQDYNKKVNAGIAKLGEKGEQERWTPASEFLQEMDNRELKLREQNKEEPDDEGDDDIILGL